MVSATSFAEDTEGAESVGHMLFAVVATHRITVDDIVWDGKTREERETPLSISTAHLHTRRTASEQGVRERRRQMAIGYAGGRGCCE